MNYLPNSTILHLILFLSYHPLNSPIRKRINRKKNSKIYHLTNDKRKKLLFFKPNNTIFILYVALYWYTLDHKNVPSNNKTKDLLPVHYSSKQQQSLEVGYSMVGIVQCVFIRHQNVCIYIYLRYDVP